MKILLVGCGNMGRLLLSSWEEEVVVVQPSLGGEKEFSKVKFVKSPGEVGDDFVPDVVVLAVKPQILPKIIEEYRRFTSALFITIAAGITSDWYLQKLGNDLALVRIMPNVAIRVGESANMAFGTKNVVDKVGVESLFRPTGPLFWMEEASLDTLAPMVGSSPAYFFHLAESLVESAVKRGIEREVATETVRQAFLGSALLMREEGELADLRKSVTSKGGVTEAALDVIVPSLSPMIDEAMEKALERTRELSL